jgi:hypothetical protein
MTRKRNRQTRDASDAFCILAIGFVAVFTALAALPLF